MRLWSLHPRYLDAKGLVALWHEALLAQKVLRGKTRGYRAHPQLDRFRRQSRPLAAIALYLKAVADEAERRGYRFDRRRIGRGGRSRRLAVSRGQMRYESIHLKKKLKQRDPARVKNLPSVSGLKPHPLFRVVDGPVESWERI